MSPRTLLIIVNWNKASVLEAMLASLEASGPRDYDAILVDNASTDNSVAMVREKFPWMTIIENPENLGGTGGFNTGLRHALNHERDYEFLWLVDNDVLVHPGAYANLLQPLLQHNDIGLVGSCILLMGRPDYVQECGGLVHWPSGRIFRGYEGNLAELPSDRLLDVDFSAACSLMVRTKAVRQVGIWDPNYFLLWDDVEWGVRISRAGWRVVATPKSRVEHESYDNRRGQSSALSTYLAVRNGLYFNSRHAPRRHFVPNLYFQLRTALGFAENFRASGRTGQAAVIELAISDFLSGRMGSPPADLQKIAMTGESTSSTEAIPHLSKIAVLCRDNPQITRDLYDRLQQQCPGAKLDTIILNPTHELIHADLPGARVLDARTRPGRLRLARICATEYDAVAAPAFMQEFLFERCAPISLRFDPQTTSWQLRARSSRATARALFRRLFLPLRVLSIIARAWKIRKIPVDYFSGISRGE